MIKESHTYCTFLRARLKKRLLLYLLVISHLRCTKRGLQIVKFRTQVGGSLTKVLFPQFTSSPGSGPGIPTSRPVLVGPHQSTGMLPPRQVDSPRKTKVLVAKNKTFHMLATKGLCPSNHTITNISLTLKRSLQMF